MGNFTDLGWIDPLLPQQKGQEMELQILQVIL